MPYIDENGKTDAEKYLEGCLDGTYVVGRRIIALAEMMLPQIRNGYKKWRYDPAYATRVVEWIETFCMLPSGKLGVPFILEPYERMILELIFGFVDEDGNRRFKEALVEIGRKNGKALVLQTDVPTPSGWRKLKDIHPGDYVFGLDGKPSLVLVESEIFDKPTYAITFEDGSLIKASGDHIWTVMCGGMKCDVTTYQIAESYDVTPMRVPICGPVQYPKRNLPVSPWDMREAIANGETVPDEYLTSSVDQRIELMDAFSSVYHAQCVYESPCEPRYYDGMPEHQAWQLVELCSSLGYKALSSHDGCGIYQVKVCHVTAGKLITSVERVPNEPTKCIAIDNPSHLYLVGHQYTATHNTAICAALNLYMLTSDGEGAPQCINAAVNEQQASLCFGATWSMVRQSPKLAKYVKKGVVPDRKTTGLKFAPNLGYLVTVSSRSDALDGLNVHYAVLDELGASRDRSTYDLMKGSTGAQDQPLIFIISTQNYIRDNIWDIQRDYAVRWLDGTIEDDNFIGILYEMDDRSEIYNESMWPKANPGLGTVKKWDYMRSELNKAENDPSYMNQVLIKQFNLPANQSTAYFSYDEAVNETMYDFDPRVFRYCVVGFDAADTLDLNAATALFMKPGDNHIYRRSMYWIAEEQVRVNTTSMRGRDGVPYELWASRGLIRIVPGNKVDRRVFLDWIQELADEGLYTRYVGYDPWHMDVIVPELKMMVGDENVEVVRQGVQTLSQPMKQLKADLRDKRIVNNHNPIDEWTILNVAAKIDINDNVQPVKKGSATTRIDGFMALLDAYITLQRHEQDYLQIIGWDKGL